MSRVKQTYILKSCLRLKNSECGGQGFVRDPRIGSALRAESGNFIVPRHKGHVIAEGPEFARDGIDQVLEIPAGKIGSADRPLEQDVADLGETSLTLKKYHVAGRVSRAVADVELRFSDDHPIPVAEPSVRGEGAGERETPTRTAGGDVVDPELVVRVWPLYRRARRFFELRDPSGMVEMAMGDPDLFQGQVVIAQHAKQTRDLASRVDHCRPQCFDAPHDRAVLLQRRHRDHGRPNGRFNAGSDVQDLFLRERATGTRIGGLGDAARRVRALPDREQAASVSGLGKLTEGRGL